MVFKVYSAQPGCEGDINQQVNDYLKEHPGSYIQSHSIGVSQYRICVSIVFDDGVVHMPYTPPNDPGFVQPHYGPFGPIGPVITKDDDPWKGEFIPIGDPPMPRVNYQARHTTEEIPHQ